MKDDTFLPARAVWERFGVTSMSLHRWLADPRMSFPRPVYIGRFRYWKLTEIVEWESSRPRVSPRVTSGVINGRKEIEPESAGRR